MKFEDTVRHTALTRCIYDREIPSKVADGLGIGKTTIYRWLKSDNADLMRLEAMNTAYGKALYDMTPAIPAKLQQYFTLAEDKKLRPSEQLRALDAFFKLYTGYLTDGNGVLAMKLKAHLETAQNGEDTQIANITAHDWSATRLPEQGA